MSDRQPPSPPRQGETTADSTHGGPLDTPAEDGTIESGRSPAAPPPPPPRPSSEGAAMGSTVKRSVRSDTKTAAASASAPSSGNYPLVDSSSDEEEDGRQGPQPLRQDLQMEVQSDKEATEEYTHDASLRASSEETNELNASSRAPISKLDTEARRLYKSLENELAIVKEQLSNTKKENEAVKLSLIEMHKEKKQLQLQLDVARKAESREMEQRESAASALREAELEKLVTKVKKEKEKALRLVISLIGRDKVLEHLQKHDGREDILDALVADFSSSRLVENRSMKGTASSAKKQQKHPAFVGLSKNASAPLKTLGGRSRSAERSRSLWMSVHR